MYVDECVSIAPHQEDRQFAEGEHQQKRPTKVFVGDCAETGYVV